MSRRLPVYLLIDCSAAMKGDRIHKARVAVDSIVETFMLHPVTMSNAYLSVITFENEAKVLMPLTPLLDFQTPDFSVSPDGGGSFLGTALELLEKRVRLEVQRKDATHRGDWFPLIFILTDGKPSDTATYRMMSRRVRSGEIREIRPQNMIVYTVGSRPDPKALYELADNVIPLSEMKDSDIYDLPFFHIGDDVLVSQKNP